MKRFLESSRLCSKISMQWSLFPQNFRDDFSFISQVYQQISDLYNRVNHGVDILCFQIRTFSTSSNIYKTIELSDAHNLWVCWHQQIISFTNWKNNKKCTQNHIPTLVLFFILAFGTNYFFRWHRKLFKISQILPVIVLLGILPDKVNVIYYVDKRKHTLGCWQYLRSMFLCLLLFLKRINFTLKKNNWIPIMSTST